MNLPDTPYKIGSTRILNEGKKWFLCRATPPIHKGFCYVVWKKIKEVPNQTGKSQLEFQFG
jgi:hypothetical protein